MALGPRGAQKVMVTPCCPRRSYPHVNVTNFTSSWKDGLAFNALIHKHRYILQPLVGYGVSGVSCVNVSLCSLSPGLSCLTSKL